MALELAFAPWSDEVVLTVVGVDGLQAEIVDRPNLRVAADLDPVLESAELRVAEQRSQVPAGLPGHHRISPEVADAWAPEVLLIGQPLSPEQERRLVLLAESGPSPLAMVVAGPVGDAPWTLHLDAAAGPAGPRSRLDPAGLVLTPQRLESSAAASVLDLLRVTASQETVPAPWWTDDVAPAPPGDNVTYLGKRFGGWATAAGEGGGGTVAPDAIEPTSGVAHPPILQLLGPVELSGAAGQPPTRASKQCLEYCGWLLEHPGTTAQAMAAALVVAEGTRRSNMSRLRTWLGSTSQGEPYLPDAYSGRIFLHPAVSSDWQRLQILTAAGVNRTSDNGLTAALELVRGAPLADAAPGQWHWAEELRTDMISAIRDIGFELADRALTAGNLDQARWAAGRALVAAPGDELLLATRIRTEHRAGNVGETERLTLQLAAQARSLGVDLDPATVGLLQEVMEGRVRARLA